MFTFKSNVAKPLYLSWCCWKKVRSEVNIHSNVDIQRNVQSTHLNLVYVVEREWWKSVVDHWYLPNKGTHSEKWVDNFDLSGIIDTL